MCGIVGYIGRGDCVSNIIYSLYKMEYRGYDSAGIAFHQSASPKEVLRDAGNNNNNNNDNNYIKIIKKEGKIKSLETLIGEEKDLLLSSSVGIGHTRWATHGEANDINSHPHSDCSARFVVVHNGIIDNYVQLKEMLIKRGHHFRSDTDTEVISHLIEENYKGYFEEAVVSSIKQLKGTYGLIVLSSLHPSSIIAARYGSPVILGKGKDENIVASDVAAILKYTSDVIYLEDGEFACIEAGSFSIKNLDNKIIERSISQVNWKIEDISKEGYATYMLKEIYEQSESIRNAIKGRVNSREGNAVFSAFINCRDKINSLKRVIIIGMGTSFYSALLGKYYIEEMARIPVDVEYASEFSYRGPIVDSDTLVIVISQSGETADTLGGLREAKLKGALVYSICNVVGSSIARESDGGIFLHAGPEIGVASTKSFTAQIIVLLLIALFFGRSRRLSLPDGSRITDSVERLPFLIEQVLEKSSVFAKDFAKRFYKYKSILYLGRGYNFPVALEGALKLKEISYIHAEGYNISEMKHGPIALIDENMPVVVIALRDYLYEKTVVAIEEIKSRKGIVIAVATEGDEYIAKIADYVFYIPNVSSYLSPILSILPLQLFAYYIATYKGCNVDQPRNLAKSVTV